MDSLFEAGMVILGGPFADKTGSLVIVMADNAAQVHELFRRDPWTEQDVLVVAEVKEWTIFLDSRNRIEGESGRGAAMDPPLKQFSHIAPVFRVRDLARSVAFYREQLGFDQAAFELKEHLDACLVVQGAATLSRTFAAAGLTFTVPLRQMRYGTEFYIRDPDGYILGFVQPAPA
jgi:catechol 2,3-dioxygenase-like lactoylglutathione lyase family enzyme